METGKNLATTMDVSGKVAQIYQTRVRKAFEHYDARVKKVRDDYFREMAMVQSPLDVWRDWAGYAVDSMQRGILFLDAMRQRGNQYLEHTRSGLPPVLHFDYEMVMDGRTLERAVNYALVRIVPPAGVTVDREAPPIRDHRPARRPRPGHRRIQGRLAGRRGAARGTSRLLRDLLPESGTRPDPARRLCGRTPLHRARARTPPGEPEAGDRRQLPGRLGGDDARGLAPRRHRADRHQRRADVVLGRRVGRRPERQPDALCRRHARRHLDVVDGIRHGRGSVRRRVSGAELREPESGQHVVGQVLQRVPQGRHRDTAFPRVRALVGRVLPDEPRGDRVDHAEPVRRQQAVDRRHVVRARARCSTCARSARRSCCSPRWATTSRRRSRRSTGSPTYTARPTRSRRADR